MGSPDRARSTPGGALQQLDAARTHPAGSPTGPGHPLWRRAFRPFFLGAGLYAGFVLLAWTAIWRGALPAPGWLAPSQWHAHEMLFGLAAAAIAGFLLTASPVWTGRRALAGPPLAALLGLWGAGRLVMLGAGLLPAWFVAAVDLAFLPAVALVLARTLRGTGQVRNYGVLALVAALAAANAAVHAGALGLTVVPPSLALRFAVDLVVVLVVVIGGRITPPFTANALRRAGVEPAVRSRPAIGALAVGSVALVAAMDLLFPGSRATGAAAIAAGVLVGARMAGWQTLRTQRDPLVWSLHAGMAWVVLGLLLAGFSNLGRAIPSTAGLHALTAGAIGSMILAVMTRVGLGHTGRPLALPRGAAASYGLVHGGAVARVAAGLSAGALQGTLLLVAGLLWAAAYWLFALIYWPILTRPRVDGKDG